MSSTIAKRMKEAMDIRKMRQTDLVQITQIGKSSISTYLSGEYDPKQKNIYKIAKALNVSEAWLMGYDVPMERKKADNNMDNNESIHLSSNEQKLVTNYRTLNEDGQERLLEYSEDMVLSGRYIKTDKNGLLEKEA